MKKSLLLITLLAIMLMCVSVSWAGSIDYLTVQSAEGTRDTSRESVIDSSDIANYNPAGTVFLPKNGLYINLGNTFAFLNYKLELTTTLGNSDLNNPYESSKPALLIPSLFLVYKQTDWAVFGAVTIPGGGGSVNYKNGIPMLWKQFGQELGQLSTIIGGGNILTDINITNANVEASSMYIGTTVGGSYKINDQLSVSAGIRYIYSKKNAIGGANVTLFGSIAGAYPLGDQVLDYSETASGFGGIFGVHIKPTKELNIGIRYEMKTKLEFEYSVTTNDSISGSLGITNANKHRYDLPGLLAIGASYDITPEFTAAASLIYYFIKAANENNSYENYDNGYEINMSFGYTLSPELKLTISGGISKKGSNEKTISDLAVVLDSLYFAGGAAWLIMPDMTINFGVALTTYSELTGDNTIPAAMFEKFDRSVLSIGLGVEYRI
ncbi:MAG: outer membrane protein transport protein [Spirochaetes bacterium]|nr:outer membrane protein transport protein [Spirochaetota bacterium]